MILGNLYLIHAIEIMAYEHLSYDVAVNSEDKVM